MKNTVQNYCFSRNLQVCTHIKMTDMLFLLIYVKNKSIWEGRLTVFIRPE